MESNFDNQKEQFNGKEYESTLRIRRTSHGILLRERG